ncbi:GNAT family N-acetyltransferase [Lutibaculum baratangense]|uniref:50S ribosomal protein acetyltransferase n=1 Tax=Lutibaculum baratangense AMV1 TaxID=631454 RepID=V4RGP2_9HYPH|nr:GNAT family N-acetyltransferase [Lutibaculum baratangense]ESR25321.1 50S ribosomal protein acetyltransferase [Lutibaculum baratangense AMV1]
MNEISEHEALGRDRPVLASQRLLLRLAGPDDADALYAQLNDWDVVRMLARVSWPVPEKRLREFLDGVAPRALRGAAEELAVLPGGREPAGIVGIEYDAEGAHIGYWLGRAHWGRGLMTEAVSLVLSDIFRRRPDCRVASGVFEDNPASLRVQQKLGFEVVGSHMRWCEARRANVRHIDTALTRETFRKDAR